VSDKREEKPRSKGDLDISSSSRSISNGEDVELDIRKVCGYALQVILSIRRGACALSTLSARPETAKLGQWLVIILLTLDQRGQRGQPDPQQINTKISYLKRVDEEIGDWTANSAVWGVSSLLRQRELEKRV
jgi:hypothetical protein